MKKLKEKLSAKLSKNGGFTMVEMLIVVAIIAILMAVSIPLFNNALEKARHGVDAANIRSAISMANAEVIVAAKPSDFAAGKYYDYIVDNDGDHQAELREGTATGTDPDGAKVQCASAPANAQTLKVKISYDGTQINLMDQIKVETNWSIDGNGHTTVTAFS